MVWLVVERRRRIKSKKIYRVCVFICEEEGKSAFRFLASERTKKRKREKNAEKELPEKQ